MSKGSKQEFMTKLLAGSGFKVLNGTGIKNMKNGHVAKLTINTGGTSGHYDRLILKIVNKKEGEIDSSVFKFSEHLVSDPKNPRHKDHKTLEIIDHTGWDWYIAYPTKESIKSMIDAINEYVGHFDDEASAKLVEAGIELKGRKFPKKDLEKAISILKAP